MARGKRGARMTSEPARWGLPGRGRSDIEAIAFLVLMQAAKSAQEDLKAIMEAVRQSNGRKKRRKALRRLEDTGCRPDRIDAAVRGADLATRTATKLMAAIDELSLDSLREDLDAMSELGEMESLRLQMAMDRMSKMMSTLSNLLKKISDTADAITANLK